MSLNRRKFISSTSFSLAGIITGSALQGCTAGDHHPDSSYDIMKDVMRYRKFDAHCHPEEDLDKQLALADSLGIEKLQISMPVPRYRFELYLLY